MWVWFGRAILSFVVLGFLGAAAVEAQNTGNQGNGAGFRALSGAEAAFFVLPGDVELTNSMRLERYGLTYERYQQFFGAAKVLGGQLTLHRDDTGAITTVIGAHYPGIAPANAVGLTAANARGIAERDIGAAGERSVELMIDPRTGRHFFRVETQRPDSLWVLWIGAQNGQIINKYDALKYLDCATGVPTPCGFGVEYDDGDSSDVKDLNGLTYDDGTEYLLWSGADRLGTYDYWDYIPGFGYPLARDDDDAWILLGDQSPAQSAEVDGQYYGHITNQYYLTRHTYDWVAQSIAHGGLNAMVIMVHYGTNYNNAFWNKASGYVRFGDGDQVTFREFPSLDIVAHELTHGVTDFTSGLIYQNESGALNEAFSDIMAVSIEFYAQAELPEPSPNLTADWLIGEDIYIPEFGTAAPGFRNMADPEEDGNPLFKPEYPDHYDERYLGSEDNGGVHFNSSIPSHAYYLLVNGGLNASCASPGDHNSLHCTGLEVPVTGIGMADAEAIFFLAFMSLGSNATLCDARAATEVVAAGVGDPQLSSTLEAWEAVGLDDQVCGLPLNNDNPPTVTIAEPTGGSTVGGKRVKLRANAGDDNGVTQVEFHLDGALIGTDDNGSDGWLVRWDSRGSPNGPNQLLTATARDTTGQETTSATVSVTIDNGGGDTGDPSTVNCKKKQNRNLPACNGG